MSEKATRGYRRKVYVRKNTLFTKTHAETISMRALTRRGEHMIDGQIDVVGSNGSSINNASIYVTWIPHDSSSIDRVSSVLPNDGKRKKGGIGGSGILFSIQDTGIKYAGRH
ncbi:MAG: hypothetical protein H6936_17215 [Burkholderiales bacterium]|nr:hypothetical protein [Burkholderiales bacterium]